MNPFELILWAVGMGLAWLIFASLTGADEWLKSLFGRSQVSRLERRIEKLERRLDDLGKK
jgi:uncharacterized membrane protein YciS (DUF1049 family)